MNNTNYALPIDQLWRPDADTFYRLGRALALFCGALALLIASGKIQVMLPTGVPFTLQTYVLVMLPMLLGARLSLGALFSYFGLGLMGLPVFAAGGGLAYFTGPTGGYLLGFVVATVLLARLTPWGQDLGKAVLAIVAAVLIIFALGFAWLTALFGAATAWSSGVQPFLLSELLKIALAVFSLKIIWAGLNARKQQEAD